MARAVVDRIWLRVLLAALIISLQRLNLFMVGLRIQSEVLNF
jgi:hypothetical protein